MRRSFIALLGLGVALGLATATQAGPVVTEDCEPLITKISDFGQGAGALRNTSTLCGQSGGWAKTKSVTVVVSLIAGGNGLCGSDVSRTVQVNLDGVGVADSPAAGTPDDPIITEASKSLVLSGGASGRFKFSASYNKTSCLDGEGPVAKSVGGVNQVNDPGFRWDATATTFPADTGPDADSASDTAPLLCKPCRTQ